MPKRDIYTGAPDRQPLTRESVAPPVAEPEWGEVRRPKWKDGIWDMIAPCGCYMKVRSDGRELSAAHPCNNPHTLAHLVSGEARLRAAMKGEG